jgi:Fur family ferric uptake transcriptional regulator
VVKSSDNGELFKKCGIKNTKQRNILLDILREEKGPLTAEEIFSKARKVDQHINLSTIYRTLNIFVSKNIAVKLNVEQENKSMFQLKILDHDHYIICVSCHKKVSIDHCPIIGYEHFIKERTDFDIIGHKLEIFGYCPKCKNRSL